MIETVIERIEQGMAQWGIEPPPPLEEGGGAWSSAKLRALVAMLSPTAPCERAGWGLG